MPSFGKPNREDTWKFPSPLSSKEVPLTAYVNLDGSRETWKYGSLSQRESRAWGFIRTFSYVLLVVLIAALCVSNVWFWVHHYWGCPNLLHDNPSAPSDRDEVRSIKGNPKITDFKEPQDFKEENGLQIFRRRRDEPPLYVTQDQYIEDRSALLDKIDQATNHPAAQYVLNHAYVRKHSIDTMVSLYWSEAQGRLFNLTSQGRELQVVKSGYYHFDLTAMFSGRRRVTGTPSCSLKLARKAPAGRTNHTTLMFVSTTQDQRGLPVRAHSPIDTANAASIFLLRRGDVLHVRPDSWTLTCVLMTEPTKTHLDVFLIKAIGD